MKKVISLIMVFLFVLSLSACGEKAPADETPTITIAYQQSIGFAPLMVMKEKGLLENNYDGELNVDLKLMKGGAEINEALISGALDVGVVGVPVAIKGVLAGSPYKIAGAMCAQPYLLLTNKPEIQTLADITSEDQIAAINLNSQNHILLEMACKKILGDPHALDGNVAALSNSEGYTSMLSGAVSCHLVSSPICFMELESQDADIHEIEIGPDIWPPENTAIVTIVRNSLHDNEKLYGAFMTAMDEAMQFINENPEETAEIVSQYFDASAEEILKWMQDPRYCFDQELHGVMEMADFMIEIGLLDEGPSSIDEIAYDNVKGN